ncbi:unnamed protein product [Rotaria socialis]|uniref:G-protein coupled receptors family 1 profile domain-containing protein n=1 Tax=Rotaria socialis TaxID=392032 RepID=A0A817QTP5_9BILA|nr:unnamed protein product [Rotaria socialis]CAF3373076.1 unnamed protein product [Rotaria socialis]CAF3381696.1 unnamed protein product [Rotaria socialis]CAF3396332.1 unnamed protein product [Rotaria socialis]CAF3600244.1 unnamed protein product [Rotaria socialis]
MAVVEIPVIGQFWMFLISNCASVLCSIFVLYHLLFDRQLRHSLHNHVVLVLLIINFIIETTDIPWLIYYLKHGVNWLVTPFFCKTWKLLDIALYETISRLVAWAAIERHILVFHDRWLATKRKRFFLHYLPIILIIAYNIVLNVAIIYFLSCDRPLYPSVPYCYFYSCAYDSVAFSLFELATSGILNAFCIAVFSAGLLIRIVRQKLRAHQEVNWRKQRKMTIQLLSITLLFYIFFLPAVITGILTSIGFSSIYMDEFVVYAQFFSFYINFLLPFVCAGTLPDLKLKIENALKFWTWHKRINAVVPFANSTLQQRTRTSTRNTRISIRVQPNQTVRN